MNNTEEKLEGCPFCGSEEYFEIVKEQRYAVRCRTCFADGPYADMTTKKKAIEAWNTRTHPKPLVLPEKKYIDGLEVFLEDSGPLHDQDCPCDDTCQCSYKIANDGADICCKFLKQFSIDEVEKLNAGPGIAGIKSC